MPAHPSHSSNLSPLAPPFTVVSSLPRWSPFSGASFIPRPSQSAAGGEALYPEPEGYGVGQWDWSSPIGGGEGNGGRGAGSSWLEPSYKAEGYCADSLPPLENSSDVWHENHLGSFAGKAHLGSAECSESLYQRHPSVYEADAGPPKISRDLVLARHPSSAYGADVGPPKISRDLVSARHPSSAYGADVGPPKISRDLALAHCSSAKRNFYSLAESSINLDSCDTFMGYTANSCANIAQVHEPSSRITTSFADFSMLKNGYSEDQLANPYKTDTHFKDQNSSHLKHLSGNQFAGVKEFYDEMLGKSNMKVRTSMPVYSFSSRTSLPSRSDFTNGILKNTSSEVETVEAGIKLKPLILPSASIYESGLAEPSTSNGTSSQALDQINCYVDSPCWKRTPTSLTSVGLNPSVRELTKADDFYQDQKHLPLSIDNSETSPSQQVGTLICNEIGKASPDFSLSESPVVILPSLPNNLGDASKLRSDCLKNNNDEMNYNSEACMDKNRNSEGNGIKAPLDKDEIVVSSIQPFEEGTFANNVTDLKPETQGSPSVNSCAKQFSGNHVELLVKSISSLSEVLLSSFIGGTNELKDQDHDLLELARHNLELVTGQNKKAVVRGSIIPSERNAAGSRDMNLEPDGLNMTNNVTNHGINEKVNSSGNNVSVDGVKESSMTCMAQAFEKVFEENFPEQEENPQALIYKNLWMEAEAALCSMKYEVQRSRLRMETENLKHLVKGSSSQTPFSSLRNSVHVLDGGGLQKAEDNMASHQSGAGGGLQKAEEGLPHQSGTEGNCDIKSCQETSDKSEVLDASVLATLSFLESPTSYSDSTVRHEPRACVGTKEMIMPEYFPGKYSDTAVKELVPRANTVNYSAYLGRGYGRYCSTSSEVFDGYNNVDATKAYPPFRQRYPPIGFAGPSSEWEHVLKEDLTL